MPRWIVAGVAATLGIGLLSGGVKQIRAILKYHRTMVRTKGKIIGWEERTVKGDPETEDRLYYDPRVRFRPKSGPDVTFTSSEMGYLSKPPLGKFLLVEYRPDRPKVARVAEPIFQWVKVVLWLFFGLLSLGMAVCLFVGSPLLEITTPERPD